MATIFDPAGFTLSPEEVKSVGECIFTDSFQNPSITDFHQVFEGIIAKKKIPILGRLKGLLGKGDGECNPTSSTNQVESSSKTWDPVIVSDRLEQCYKDLVSTFWTYILKKGIQKPDVTGTDYANYISDVVSEAIFESVLRLAWLGDTAADTVANSSYLTNGTEKKYFNKINGFWKQFLAIVAADATKKTSTILTTRNAGASYAAQQFTSTDTTNLEVSNALTAVRFGADKRLRRQTNLVYICTQSVMDQYEKELIFANINYTTERLENGVMTLKNGGIELMSFELLDRLIDEYMDNGTKLNNPHRLVLTTKDNLGVGVESTGNLSELDIFYDKKTKTNIVDFQYTIDAKVLKDEYVQLSY